MNEIWYNIEITLGVIYVVNYSLACPWQKPLLNLRFSFAHIMVGTLFERLLITAFYLQIEKMKCYRSKHHFLSSN